MLKSDICQMIFITCFVYSIKSKGPRTFSEYWTNPKVKFQDLLIDAKLNGL